MVSKNTGSILGIYPRETQHIRPHKSRGSVCGSLSGENNARTISCRVDPWRHAEDCSCLSGLRWFIQHGAWLVGQILPEKSGWLITDPKCSEKNRTAKITRLRHGKNKRDPYADARSAPLWSGSRRWRNAGTTSTTLDQHWVNVWSSD